MARIAIFCTVEELAADVPADLEDSLRARLDEIYVDLPDEDGAPYHLDVLGIEVDDGDRDEEPTPPPVGQS